RHHRAHADQVHKAERRHPGRPNGWMCHAVRAPGSNVTLAPTTRAGSAASKRGSMRTMLVKYSVGPLPDLCEPLLLMSIRVPFRNIGMNLMANPDFQGTILAAWRTNNRITTSLIRDVP